MRHKYRSLSETQRKRSAHQRMIIVHATLLVFLLVVVARLLELQVIKGGDYRTLAEGQHYGGVVLPAKRGEVLSRNSKTGEESIFATNTTLDLVYVDPLITDDPFHIATQLSNILVTQEFHKLCSEGSKECPTELADFYSASFDPILQIEKLQTGAVLEPLAGGLPVGTSDELPSLEEVQQLFRTDIQDRISEKRVTFVPFVYGATKIQMEEVRELNIPGVYVVEKTRIIFANPEETRQLKIPGYANDLSDIVEIDSDTIKRLMRSRPLR